MGLAASQARLLTLTSRQHAIEYKAQKLEAEKLQLANDSDQVYNTYLNALDATKVQYRFVNDDGTTAFSNATFGDLKNAGFLFSVNGTICNDLAGVKKALQDQKIVDLTAGDSYTLLTTLIKEGYVVVMEKNPEASDYYKFDPATGKLEYKDGLEDGHDWEYTIASDAILEKGATVETTADATGATHTIDVYDEFFKVFGDTSVSTSTKLQEVSDEVGLKKAEAQYEADMNKINKKDTRFDTELAQLETERNAIKQEIDALKNVAKDNVDRTFKIFT